MKQEQILEGILAARSPKKREDLERVLRILSQKDINEFGEHLDQKCEVCNAPQVYCGHIEDGAGVGFYDQSWHICLNCLDAHYKDDRTTQDYSEYSCPFPHKKTNTPQQQSHWYNYIPFLNIILNPTKLE